MTVRLRFDVETLASAPPSVAPRDAVVGGGVAALVAGLGMLVLRSSLGVRSIPERLLEWLLLFVPTSVFEALLQRFGLDAKRYGLDVAIVLMLAALAAIGYAALKRAWPVRKIALLGVALWLVVMLVIMPVTAAGLFAADLQDGKRAAIGGYLAVGLAYAAVLALERVRLMPHTKHSRLESQSGNGVRFVSPGTHLRTQVERRLAIGLLGGAGLAYLGTFAAALLAPKSVSVPSVMILDPQEPVPSGGIDEPNPHPQAVASPSGGPATAVPSPPAQLAAQSAPEPGVVRQIQRDKDGAVLPSGRIKGQLASSITSNADFYVVTKNAGGDPVLHPQDWRLLVDGEVQRAFQLDYTTLRKLPAVELTRTLECISNFVGKPELAPFGAELISTATWRGARVSDVLQLTGGVKEGTEWMAVLSADEYTSALPMEAVMDPATLLVYEMNGDVLPREHGYPARILVPNRYGMKNAKWVVGLRPTKREVVDWYGQRHWSKTGIVQTMSRVDSPEPGATLAAGPNSVAGVAYAGTRGIQRVEYSADGGASWREAQFVEPAPGKDCWVRWRGEFVLEPGASATLVARAADGSGEIQVEPFRLPEPDGGTGWQRIDVHARKG